MTYFAAALGGLISASLNGTFVGYNRTGIIGLSVVALAVGGTIAAAADHIAVWGSVAALAGGNVLMSLAVYFSGPYSPRAVLVYVWLALVVASFFERWVGVLHAVLVGAGYGTVLLLQGELPAFKAASSPVAAWMITAGTFCWVLIFVRWQVDRVNRFTSSEHAARRDAERASEELEVVSQHKTEFLANMSHELRTPLNAVIGFSEVLADQLFGELNDRQYEYVQDILVSGRHLLALINDILDVAKVEAGHMELEVGTVVVAELLEQGLTMVRERATAHGVELALEADGRLQVLADSRKLTQVVFNLLSNAVKFTPAGGRVTVRARWLEAGSEPAQLEVAVSDTGIGIAPEEQELVFEKFRQASGAAGRAKEGTGLGLALARQLVELHGGRIWVDSEPGRGSTFTFRVPVQPGGPTAGAASGPASGPASVAAPATPGRSAVL